MKFVVARPIRRRSMSDRSGAVLLEYAVAAMFIIASALLIRQVGTNGVVPQLSGLLGGFLPMRLTDQALASAYEKPSYGCEGFSGRAANCPVRVSNRIEGIPGLNANRASATAAFLVPPPSRRD